jgi:hypothetical protein
MKKIIHFDTTNNTSVEQNPYNNCVLSIAAPVKKIKSLALKAAEIPLVLPTVASTDGIQTIPFTISYPQPIYTSGSDTQFDLQVAYPIQGFTTLPNQSFHLDMIYPVYPIDTSSLPEGKLKLSVHTKQSNITSSQLNFSIKYNVPGTDGLLIQYITIPNNSFNTKAFYDLPTFIQTINSISPIIQLALVNRSNKQYVSLTLQRDTTISSNATNLTINISQGTIPLMTILGYKGTETTSHTATTLTMNFLNLPSPLFTDTQNWYQYPIHLTKTLYTTAELLTDINASLSYTPPEFSSFNAVFENNRFGFQIGRSTDPDIAASIVSCCIISDEDYSFWLMFGMSDVPLVFDETYATQYFTNVPTYSDTPFPLTQHSITITHDSNIIFRQPYTLESIRQNLGNFISTQNFNPGYLFSKNNYSTDTLSKFAVLCEFTESGYIRFGIHAFSGTYSTNFGNNFSFRLWDRINVAAEHTTIIPEGFLSLLGMTGNESVVPNEIYNYIQFQNHPTTSAISTEYTPTGSINLPSFGSSNNIENFITDLNFIQNDIQFSIDSNNVVANILNYAPHYSDELYINSIFPDNFVSSYFNSTRYVVFTTITTTLKTLGYSIESGNQRTTSNIATGPPIAIPDMKNIIRINDVLEIPLSTSLGDINSILTIINQQFEYKSQIYLDENPNIISPFNNSLTYNKTTIQNFRISFSKNANNGRVNVNFGKNPLSQFINLFGKNGIEPYSLTFTSTSPLLTLLGMTSGPTSLYDNGNQNLNFPSPYKLSINTYVMLYIQNLPISTTTASGLNGTFKIPLSNNSLVLNVSDVIGTQKMNTYFYEETQFRQKLQLTDKNFVLDKVKISLYDRTGLLLTALPLDWSFSLEVEFEP